MQRFASCCLNSVVRYAFCTRGTTYKTLLELDRKIRTFPVPKALRPPEPAMGSAGSAGSASGGETMFVDEHALFLIREQVEHVQVGEGGICTWEREGAWEVEIEHWKLPEGDEPRSVFPWQAAPTASQQ